MAESKIKKSLLSFPVTFQKTDEVLSEDGRFTKVKIWLMHLGKNFNGSIFEKEVVDAALPTLGYIPIVGFIESDCSGEKDFSDHRYVIIKDKDGVRQKYIGSAYGVITSSADNNAHYEERECDDGETRTFLVVDGIMWNMFEDSSEIMNRDLVKSHSMELFQDSIDAFDGYEDDDGLFHFTKFSFRAACILGDEYEPAMINSTIEVQFTMSDFISNLQSELNDKFTTFTKLVNKNNDQGGKSMDRTDFAQTVMQQFQDISNVVSSRESTVTCWGSEVPRFYLVDIQDDEVIVVDRKDNYNYYGFTFTLNGDKPEINFANPVRKKVSYANYEEGSGSPDGAFNFGKHIADIENECMEKVNQAESDKDTAEANYTQVKNDYDEIKPKYDEYVRIEQERQVEELNAQKDAKFAEYENELGENADFVALKERKETLSVDEIEKECAVIYVKVNRMKPNFSKGSNPVVGGVIDDQLADIESFIETKYGNIPIRG